MQTPPTYSQKKEKTRKPKEVRVSRYRNRRNRAKVIPLPGYAFPLIPQWPDRNQRGEIESAEFL